MTDVRQISIIIRVTIENFRFVRGNLFSNKELPFYSRTLTTLKGIVIMASSSHSNIGKITARVTIYQRIVCISVFAAIAGFFVFLWVSSRGDIDLERLFGICGFKQRHGLPCPGCGVTTSSLHFVRGHFIEAFYIQPAGAVMCIVLAVIGLLCLSRAFFATRLIPAGVSISSAVKYLLLSVVIIFACGWAVTLARALAARK